MASSRLWVIEALASYDDKQVDSSVFRELVKKAPGIIGDLGKDAREMINYRALVTLACSGVRSNGNVPLGPISENKFDKSESCENVVRHLLKERTDEEEMLRSEVQNFITRKRASLPKTTLQKLKDAILEGKHPAFASLKEKSKLSVKNKSGKIIVLDDANLNEATGVSDSQTVADGENLTTANIENLNAYSQKDCRTNPNEDIGLSDSQPVVEGDNVTSPNVEISLEECRTNRIEAINVSDSQTVADGENLTTANIENLNAYSQKDCRTNPNEDIGLSDRQPVVEGDNLTSPNVEISLEECRTNRIEAINVSDSQTVAEGENLATPNVEILNGHSQEDSRTNPNDATGLSDSQTVAEGGNITTNANEDYQTNANEASGLSETQTVAEGKNLTPQNLENFKGPSQKDCQTRNLTPSKRDTSGLERANPVACFLAGSSSLDHGNDTHLQITKKLKQYASRIGLVVGLPAVRHEQPKALVDKLNMDLADKETKNSRHCCAEIGRSDVAPPNGAHGNVFGEANSNVEKPQQTPLSLPRNEFRSNNFTREAQRGTDCDPVRERSSNRDAYQDERNDIAAKKNNFLSSQCTYTQDSFAYTELDFCMKCEKGGELLVCSLNACPIVVHQSCLGTAPSFDDSGKFICPFCSYSRALSDYNEIKRKASLIRKDLTVFLSCQPKHNQQRQDDNLIRNDQ